MLVLFSVGTGFNLVTMLTITAAKKRKYHIFAHLRFSEIYSSII